MRPGYTEIVFPRNIYRFFTYVYGDKVAMVWVDGNTIISSGFSHLTEWEIHKKVRKSVRKKQFLKIKGHSIQTLKERLHGKD